MLWESVWNWQEAAGAHAQPMNERSIEGSGFWSSKCSLWETRHFSRYASTSTKKSDSVFRQILLELHAGAGGELLAAVDKEVLIPIYSIQSIGHCRRW